VATFRGRRRAIVAGQSIDEKKGGINVRETGELTENLM